MSSYDEIATRIAKVIVSPESAIGLIHGILSVPMDLGYLAYGYFDTGSHYAHETERIRIVRAIDSGILNHDRIIDAIQIVFSQFNKYTSENRQNKIYSRTISSVVGRIATNSVISSKIATAIAQRASFFVAVRGGVMGNILLVGGMTERCIRTAARLRRERRCCAASGVFSACAPFYTLRHDNFPRYSFTWLAINPLESVNPVNQATPRQEQPSLAPVIRSVFWSLLRLKAILATSPSFSMTPRRRPSSTACDLALSFSSTRCLTHRSSILSVDLNHPPTTLQL